MLARKQAVCARCSGQIEIGTKAKRRADGRYVHLFGTCAKASTVEKTRLSAAQVQQARCDAYWAAERDRVAELTRRDPRRWATFREQTIQELIGKPAPPPVAIEQPPAPKIRPEMQCTRCTRERRPGLTRCAVCAERSKVQDAAARAKRQALRSLSSDPQCHDCTNPPIPGRIRCERHAERARAYQRALRAKQRA